jgi:hypothetical protein
MRRQPRSSLPILAVPLALAGCLYLRPTLDPAPWDRYGNAGALPVHGARRSTAGPVIFRTLTRQRGLAAFLAAQGEPDTLEVRGSRLAPKRILLTYRRRGVGTPRRIVLDPTGGGYLARAPEPLRRARRDGSGTRAARRRESPPAAPTAAQELECPIDPARADCLALCKDPAHEWCR